MSSASFLLCAPAAQVPRRTLVSEIDDIRAGKWDDRIKEDLGFNSAVEEVEEEKVRPLVDIPSTPEVIRPHNLVRSCCIDTTISGALA